MMSPVERILHILHEITLSRMCTDDNERGFDLKCFGTGDLPFGECQESCIAKSRQEQADR